MTPGDRSAPGRERSAAIALLALLGASLALRLVLIARGGQGFWPDESRYSVAALAVDEIARGLVHEGLLRVLGSSDHLGFKVVALVPAWAQRTFHLDLHWAAAFFGLFSTAAIAWVWGIARRAGAGDVEALGAALAIACSNAMFYWSRHLTPYDLALFWALAALYVALKPRASWLDSLLVGFLGLLAFVTYNGYWTTAAFVLAGHALLQWPRWRAVLRRSAWEGIGFAGAFGLLYLVVHLLGGDLIASYRMFAGSITQGDFQEGHLVIGAYLWNADTLMVLVWLAVTVSLLAAAVVRLPEPRAWIWLAGLLWVVGSLLLGSNVLRKFVVYGRLARQLVPFCALLTGYVGYGLWADGGRRRAVVVALSVFLVATAAWNFAGPLTQQFPTGFRERAQAAAAEYVKTHPVESGLDHARFRCVSARFMYPAPVVEELPPHQDLLVARHPLQYVPYLYEGFTHAQRDALLAADIRMRLVLLRPGRGAAAQSGGAPRGSP